MPFSLGEPKRDGRGARPFAFFRAGAHAGTAASQRPILVFEDVFKYFRPDQPTLRGVNLEIERGEFVFVTGPSGAGKSTLLQLVYRKQTPDEGRILFCGRDIARLTGDSIPYLRRNLGVVFQDFKIIPHWTVFENVAIALEILAMSKRLVRSRVAEALERVGLAGRGEDLTGGLSGGEQQRVAVARAIVTEPALLLADEPTGNLDPALAIDILTLFEEIHATGTTVVFATHDHTLLEQRPHRIVYIDEGRVREARSGLRDLDRKPEPEPERPRHVETDPPPPRAREVEESSTVVPMTRLRPPSIGAARLFRTAKGQDR
jgi:cell division transport system ATP-binding protein